MRLLLILLVLLAGCTTTAQPERWELPTSEKIICLRYEQAECGLSLLSCGDDHSVDFECLTEAKYLGPGEYLEPDFYDEPNEDESP